MKALWQRHSVLWEFGKFWILKINGVMVFCFSLILGLVIFGFHGEVFSYALWLWLASVVLSTLVWIWGYILPDTFGVWEVLGLIGGYVGGVVGTIVAIVLQFQFGPFSPLELAACVTVIATALWIVGTVWGMFLR